MLSDDSDEHARARGRALDAATAGASPPRACAVTTTTSRRARRSSAARPATRSTQAHELVAAHLEGPVAAESYIQVVEYDPELRRWYVRFTCDGRDATTIYFDLHERTLRYEVYFLPLPPEHHLELYEFLLQAQPLDVRRALLARARRRRVPRRVGSRSSTSRSSELDRIIGVLYELTERWFQPVVKLAYGSGPARKRPVAGRVPPRSANVCDSRARRGPVGVGPEVQEDRSRSGKCGSGPSVPRASPAPCSRDGRDEARTGARSATVTPARMHLALLGGGRMGEALAVGLLDGGWEAE